ncbi:fumarylacetoacetate hydrolase family protein [Kocuria oceani]|uniref:Fumarylacetoacetate hydrolase family protein n=1 Tax=Kocuria oceani TaxID=988827 RepID=A0ABV9TK51_9MICC|nr:fumarylacetoacetate hydrolase family protein [Kocuria oceani]
MRLGTVRRNGTTQAFRQEAGETVYLPVPDVGALLAGGDLRRAGEPGPAPAPEELATPVLRPGKILCAGLNYYDHAEEVGQEIPEHPTIFAKYATALIGPADPIAMPEESEKIDWEAELTAVIGSPLRHATPEQARAAIAGYTIMNDISVRDWQGRTSEWFQGKNFDRTTPVGPVVVTPDEVDPEAGLAVRCSVDGVLHQDSRTDRMIFSAVALVEYLSRFLTLEPGDLVACGTPAGVGLAKKPRRIWLRDGQEVVTEIEGIGQLRNVCTPAEELLVRTS